MEVKLDMADGNGTLYLEENGLRIAFMKVFFQEKNKLIIDQTEVMPGFEGKGLGKVLVNAAAELARKNGLRILSVCPYAKKILTKTNEFSDVM